VKVPAGNSIDLDQSECGPLQFFTCTPFDQCLKKTTTIKKFHDETDLTARIDKVCQSGAGGDNAAMDRQPAQRGVETPLVVLCYSRFML